MAQRVGRGIALLFQDHGARRGWVVSSTPRPYFTPGKDPVPIVQEVGWAPGPVWTGGKSRPIGIRCPDRPSRRQSLYRLSYPAHFISKIYRLKHKETEYFLFYTCTKLGLSHWGKHIRWGCLNIWRWEWYLGLTGTRWERNGGDCIMGSSKCLYFRVSQLQGAS